MAPFDSAATEVETTVAATVKPMTRRQKLERWVQVLREQYCNVLLANLRRIEYMNEQQFNAAREDNSILTAAANDPVLKEAGLQNDTVGEARRFFELTSGQLHSMTCFCLSASESTGKEAAARIERSASYNNL